MKYMEKYESKNYNNHKPRTLGRKICQLFLEEIILAAICGIPIIIGILTT